MLRSRKTGLSPQKFITDRSKAVLLLWFILFINVTNFIGGGLWYMHYAYFVFVIIVCYVCYITIVMKHNRT